MKKLRHKILRILATNQFIDFHLYYVQTEIYRTIAEIYPIFYMSVKLGLSS